jgi:hypothetical protein
MWPNELEDVEPNEGGFGEVPITKFIYTSLLRSSNEALCAEAFEIAHGEGHIEVVADELKYWFVQRLTIDPGVRGPFQDLATNILATALDHVRWISIVRIIRGVINQ